MFANPQAEARAEFAERSVQKLQKEVDRLEGTILVSMFDSEFSFPFRILLVHDFHLLFRLKSVSLNSHSLIF